MQSDWPLTRDLVLIGGGHTHALVLRKWGMRPLPGVRVTLINPGPSGPYTGMLPGHVAGHYSRAELDIDLVRLARFAGARIVFDKACGLDTQARQVHLEQRPPLRYDLVSLDIGVTAQLQDVPGFAAHALPVKPLGPFATGWQAFLDAAETRASGARCMVIGAGVAGVELALAMAHRMRHAGLPGASVTLLEAGSGILKDTGAQARKILIGGLSAYGITVLTNTRLVRIAADKVDLENGQSLSADFIVSAAGARPYPWLTATGLTLTDGFVDVGPDLRSVSDPNVFAAGDCAHLTHAPRPKAGVYAVREAPFLFDNLQAALSGRKLRSYDPQADYLKLISMGRKFAVGQKHAITLSGSWVWNWKDRIDQTFMNRLNAAPAMKAPEAPSPRALDDGDGNLDQMLCGGCGSKVSRPSLMAALANAGASVRSDTISGIGGDAAILKTGGRLQVISTDHLRAFIEDPYVLARIAAVHALGDIWSMGAAPQSALLSLVIPRMSEPMQSGTVSEVVAAVSQVLSDAGADLVGGHTSMGRELTVGLTITGLLDGPAPSFAGARPGDVLLLTKPIGTGVIFAAEMRGLARGEDVEAALSSMQRPLGAAARLLAPAAHAMTDVTGFGLAGHIMSFLDASGVAARISLDRVPVLAGAEQLAGQGVRSSLWRSNATLDQRAARPTSALSDLIHDPQTAGGLLAAVPAASVHAILAAFKAAGEPVFVIGEIEAGAPFIFFN